MNIDKTQQKTKKAKTNEISNFGHNQPQTNN